MKGRAQVQHAANSCNRKNEHLNGFHVGGVDELLEPSVHPLHHPGPIVSNWAMKQDESLPVNDLGIVKKS
jgi:hypothetical protein